MLNYRYDLTISLCKHDLTKINLNDKMKYLINNGYVFLYPPQNVSGFDQEFMFFPGAYISENYEIIFDRLIFNLRFPSLFD